MLVDTLQKLFSRDLNKLRTEINGYENEEKIWHIKKEIANSAGNLCLHLIGNLSTFIGKEIGKTNYIRNRELEFSLKNIPKAELIHQLDELIIVVNNSLGILTAEDLQKEYPVLVFDKKTSTEYMLVHLATHLAYHLGQINYHRRLFDN